MSRIIFVTGTDTGVGKTVVTGLLLAQALHLGKATRAVKPFCSGERTDPKFLWEMQGRPGRMETINPFYFEPPIAPWSAAKRSGKAVTLEMTGQFIDEARQECELLLVEGAGGLFSPLGEGFNAADLIRKFSAEVIVVAPNRLGVLNQALLVCEALRSRAISDFKIAMVDHPTRDASYVTNFDDLRELATPPSLVRIPCLENFRLDTRYISECAGKMRGELNELLAKKNPPDTEPRGLFP